MPGNRVIEVRLPESAEPTHGDIELLQGIFDAIMSLRFQASPVSEHIERTLTGEGWAVRSRLAWSAEARKGSECEEVTGASRAEALKHLLQLVRADQVMSAP